MNRSVLSIAAINIALVIAFGTLFLARKNYEFIVYVGVIILFAVLIGATHRRVRYTLTSLVGLTVWSALHMSGGGISVGSGRLYDVIVIPLSSRLPVLRYDQIVHIWGFGVATIVMYSLLRGSLLENVQRRISLGIVLVMAGLGVGALNEILEFVVQIVVPESGVGGYLNTSLDLCADLVGASTAMMFIKFQYLRKPARSERAPVT